MEVTASRTSGVAPLSVHFDVESAIGSETATAQPMPEFHDYEYEWDFGDPGSGSWAPTGKPKNAAKGPIAVHVFEAPGTYRVNVTKRDSSGVLASRMVTVTVSDPEAVYAGQKTICVSDATSNDFTGAPAGSRHIATNDLRTIAPLAAAGTRILFRRGSTWSSVPDIQYLWPNNAGPVTIGAYGAGVGADAYGIYSNNPVIQLASGATFFAIDSKQDWRAMDLTFTSDSQAYGAVSGTSDFQKWLFLRLKISRAQNSLGWTIWDTRNLLLPDQMAIVSCVIPGAQDYPLYVGAEHLAILGSMCKDSSSTHVVRVWQAYRSVISDNDFSGSSLSSGTGRHALKLHSPLESQIGPSPGTGNLQHRTSYSVVSDNVIGSSGPWPVNLAPEDSGSDERVSHIIFERNRYAGDHGSQSSTPLQIAIRVCGRYITVRNNILDSQTTGEYFTGIMVVPGGSTPSPVGVEIYNNTIFRKGPNSSGETWIGVSVESGCTGTAVKNNLVSFQNERNNAQLIANAGSGTVSAGNLLWPEAGFVNAAGSDPLARDFRLVSSAPVDAGVKVPVFEDFLGNDRPKNSAYDIGAIEN